MFKTIFRPFEDASVHETISAIIRNHSTNRIDIRQEVLQGVDLSFVKSVLDLGCGFGFMSEAVATRIAPNARVTGVDACADNREPLLSRIGAAGVQSEFVCMKIADKLPWPDRSFDLVVCSYSLYFFIEALPELARVLTPNGMVLAMTHSERAFRGLFDAAGLDYGVSMLAEVIHRFSAECGENLLLRHFEEVTHVNYPNAIVFHPEHFCELLTYVRFKLPYLLPGNNADEEIPDVMRRSLQDWINRHGEVIVEKDDACFRCRRPRSL